MRLHLRGPLGHGFILPKDVRRVALIAFDTQQASASDSPARLLALLDAALKQEASIVLVCQTPPDDLPLQIEVQPMSALLDICNWADYIAMDAARESLPELKKKLGRSNPFIVKNEAQILIRTPCHAALSQVAEPAPLNVAADNCWLVKTGPYLI